MASHGFHETSNDVQNIPNIPNGSDNKNWRDGTKKKKQFNYRKDNYSGREKGVEQKWAQMTNVIRGKNWWNKNCPDKLSVQGDRLEQSTPH